MIGHLVTAPVREGLEIVDHLPPGEWEFRQYMNYVICSCPRHEPRIYECLGGNNWRRITLELYDPEERYIHNPNRHIAIN